MHRGIWATLHSGTRCRCMVALVPHQQNVIHTIRFALLRGYRNRGGKRTQDGGRMTRNPMMAAGLVGPLSSRAEERSAYDNSFQ